MPATGRSLRSDQRRHFRAERVDETVSPWHASHGLLVAWVPSQPEGTGGRELR
jgi:hypothetical protein